MESGGALGREISKSKERKVRTPERSESGQGRTVRKEVIMVRDAEVMKIAKQSFFFNDTATTEIYALSLHDALPFLDLWGAVLCTAHETVLFVSGAEHRTPELFAQAASYYFSQPLQGFRVLSAYYPGLATCVMRLWPYRPL